MPEQRPVLPGSKPSLLRELCNPWAWKMAWRDSRSQRKQLAVFAVSIVSGIAALAAIHSLRDTFDRAVELQSRALLGSDLQISSRDPFSPEDLDRILPLAEAAAEEVSFSTMLYLPSREAARLVQLRGFEPGFPYYGTPRTEPGETWNRFQESDGVLLEPALLEQFGLRIGESVRIGDLSLPILGTIIKPIPRSGRFAGFAPEVYLRRGLVEATGLLETTSLAFYHLHLKLPPATDPRSVRGQVQKERPEAGWRFTTEEDRREQIGEGLDLFQVFLGLVAMVAIVLGAVGVACGIQAHLRRRIGTIAILRCLGASGNLAFSVYLAQALAIGLAATLAGGILGGMVHLGTVWIFQGTIPFQLPLWPSWGSLSRAALAGFSVCCFFAILPLLRIQEVTPIAILRRGATYRRAGWLQWKVLLTIVALSLSLVVLGILSAASPWQASLMTLGLALAFAILASVARMAILLARHTVRPSWPYLARQGISNLHRPDNQTLLFLFSLGLGVFIVLTTLLAQNQLLQRIAPDQMDSSPNVYLVDVQSDQVEGIRTVLEDQGLPILEKAHMVTMRLHSINGVSARQLREDGEIPSWILRRDFRSSYRVGLNETERVVAGQLHQNPSRNSGHIPVSVEREMARDLGVGLGDEIILDIQGILLKTEVTSLREVDWSRFNLNFFLLFPPGTINQAPGFHVVTTRVAEGRSSGELQRRLAPEYPNVSTIDLAALLETIREILQRLALVVKALAVAVVVAALAILIGALMNGREQRIYESVLLRTLGASSRQIRSILWLEYASLGLLSGATGVILAVIANVFLAIFVFEGSIWPPVGWIGLSLFLAVLLSLGVGLSLSRGVSRESPLQILRRS